MILPEELKKVAKMFSTSIIQQQVHYFQAIVLGAVSNFNLVFKGGTYLWFCHKLPRFSEDLDFTIKEDINTNKLRKTIIDTLYNYGAEAEIKTKKMINKDISLGFRIDIKGLFYTGKPQSKTYISIDISKREKPILDIKPCRLQLDYYEMPEFYVNVLDLREVFAEKVRAVLTRNKGRDLYDLYFLIEKGYDFDIDLINEKLKYCNLKFDKNIFLKKVVEMQKTYKTDISNLTKSSESYDLVKKTIIKQLK